MNKSPLPHEKLVLTRQQVRDCDRVAMERFSISGLVLMENAGAAAACLILSRLETPARSGVCIVSGTGNNGGDGFVLARHLCNAGVSVDVVICGSRARIKGDALSNLVIIEKMGLPIVFVEQSEPEAIGRIVAGHAGSAGVRLVVDAMLGTGAAGPPRQPIGAAIKTLKDLDKPIIALDIPSGLDCDTGLPMETAIRAEETITFAALKKGFQVSGATEYTGSVTVASIGIAAERLLA